MTRCIGLCEDYDYKLIFKVLPWAMRVFRHHIIYDLHCMAALRSSDPRRDLTCPDTSTPTTLYPWDTPDRWLQQLQQRIDTQIREAEARAREQMAVISDPARHTRISSITATTQSPGTNTPAQVRSALKSNPRGCFFDR